MSARLTQTEINTGWWNVNCCEGKFRGQMVSHCTACCETFSRPSVADKHRRNGKCLDPATLRSNAGELVFKQVERPGYSCWTGAGDESRAWVEAVAA